MSRIELEISVQAPFRYLWLKYVTGINLNQHCARGLLGQYSKKITRDTGQANIVLDEHPFKTMYLCGVSQPYRWEKNFHLAFAHAPGETVDYESNGITTHIQNARRIVFEGYDAKELSQSEHRDKKAYYTCRNWIFANYAQANGLL